MLEKLSNKKKFYALLVFIVILVFVSYVKSFLPTYYTIQNFNIAKQKTENTEQALQEISQLQNTTKLLDNIIGEQTEKPELVQNKILDFLSTINNDITIFSIDKTHITTDAYFKIYSNSLILKGDYNSLVKTIYDFEKQFKYARIATVKFYVSKNRKTKKNELFNKIIFQNYEKTN